MKKTLSIIVVVLMLVTIVACETRRTPNYGIGHEELSVPTPVPTPAPTPEPTPAPTPVPRIDCAGSIDGTTFETDYFTMSVPESTMYDAPHYQLFKMKAQKDTSQDIYLVSKDHSLIANGIDRAAIEDYIFNHYGTNREFNVLQYEEMTGEEGSSGVRVLCEVTYRGKAYYTVFYAGTMNDIALEIVSNVEIPTQHKAFAEALYESFGTIVYK